MKIKITLKDNGIIEKNVKSIWTANKELKIKSFDGKIESFQYEKIESAYNGKQKIF